MKQFYFVEITDTFGGEANYCWVKRYKVKASSFKGAAQKVGLYGGGGWRKVMDSGDFMRYDSPSGATCYFLSEFDEEDKHYNLTEI